MQIETLKAFCDLVESKSFSHAAARNFITQPAVSQQVKGLEERFGRPLLARDGRLIVPTEAGRILYDAAREILDRFNRMQSELKSVGQEMAGAVRVASIYSVGLYELSPVIKTFLRTYPGVNLHVEYSRANRVYEDCLSGAVDLGIVPFPKPRRGIQVLALPSDQLVLICPPEHPFARKGEIDIRALDGQNFVAFEQDIPSRHAIEKILDDRKIRVRVVMEFDNIETIKRSVEIGAGIAIVPLLSVQREVQSGTLKQVLFARENFYRTLGIIVKRNHSLSPPARKFIELLQNSQPGASPQPPARRKKKP